MSGKGRAPEARATHERGGGDSTSARKPRKKKAHKRHKRSSKDKKRHRHREPRNTGRRDDHTTRPKKRRRRRVLSSSSDSDPLSASEFFSSFTPRTVSPPVANTIPVPAREPWSAATRQLFMAAKMGLEEVVKRRIAEGADVLAANEEGKTALHVASELGHTSLVSVLVDAGCPIDDLDSSGNSPLLAAMLHGQGPAARALYNKGASVDVRNLDDVSPTSLGIESLMRGDKEWGGKRAASQKRAEEEAWRDKLSAELDHDSFRQRDQFAEAWWRDEEADARGKTAAETADAFFDRIAREASAKRRQRASSPGVGGGSFVHGAPRRSQHHGSTNGGDTARGTLPSSSQRPRVFGPASENHSTAGSGSGSGSGARDAWVTSAAAKSGARQREDEAWEAFVTSSTNSISDGDIPWPDVGSDTRYGLGIHTSMTPAAKRARVRCAQLRWHPDKFMQKFGARLLPTTRDEIMARVKRVSQAINAMAERVKAEVASAGA